MIYRAARGRMFLVFAVFAVALASARVNAETSSGSDVSVAPSDSASVYLKLVADAEAEVKDVDFGRLRHAYVAEGFAGKAWQARAEIAMWRQDMALAEKSSNWGTVRALAKRILTKQYIDMQAHRALAHACAADKWDRCTQHYNRVYLGLLQSVVKTGDGKTCVTAWKIVSREEEAPILDVYKVTMARREAITMDGRRCDEVRAEDTGGGLRNMYFDVADVPTEELAEVVSPP